MKVKLINFTGDIVTLVKTIRLSTILSPGPIMGLYAAKAYAEKLIDFDQCDFEYTVEQEMDNRQFVINAALVGKNNRHPVTQCECQNPAQCWEQCGELGQSEHHVALSDTVILPLNPATDKMYVWVVGSKSFNLIFSTEEKANEYASTFPASSGVRSRKVEVL
jgi:hypothetical protein